MSQYIIDPTDLLTSVTTAAGSSTVNATGWTPSSVLTIGDWVRFAGDKPTYTVASAGASSFTITAPYPTTRTGIAAVIHRDFANSGIPLAHFEAGDLAVPEFLTRNMELIAQSIGAGFVAKGLILAEQTTPPGSPSTGDAYIVTATATGDWAGEEGEIATYDGADWTFSGTPAEGWWVYNADTDTVRLYSGGAWNDWTVTLLASGGGNKIYPVYFGPQAEATIAGNVDYMQAKILLRNGGIVTGIQCVQADAAVPTAGNTSWDASDTDYAQAGTPQTETLNVAHDANDAASSGWTPITIPAGGYVYIYCSAVDASGGHARTQLLLEVVEL